MLRETKGQRFQKKVSCQCQLGDICRKRPVVFNFYLPRSPTLWVQLQNTAKVIFRRFDKHGTFGCKPHLSFCDANWVNTQLGFNNIIITHCYEAAI